MIDLTNGIGILLLKNIKYRYNTQSKKYDAQNRTFMSNELRTGHTIFVSNSMFYNIRDNILLVTINEKDKLTTIIILCIYK